MEFMTVVLLAVVRFLVVSILIFPVSQISTSQDKYCKSGSNEPCGVLFSWQGCYDLSDGLEYSYESALGYEELFRDEPKANQRFKEWTSEIPKLVCRCASMSSKWEYEFFALKFYGVCYGGVSTINAKDRNKQACYKVNAENCTKTDYSRCFRIGTRKGVALYKIVQKNSTHPYTRCFGDKIIKDGSMPKYDGNIDKNDEENKTALLRLLNELNNCTDINLILKIIKKIIAVFRRPEIYKSFNTLKGLQESFMSTLSKIIGENFKYLWKKTVKVQYLVEMVQEMSVLILRSISFTNLTEYNFQTPNIDIAANFSSNEETSLYFNATTSDTSILLDDSFQGSRPSNIAAVLYKNIYDIYPANMNYKLQGNSSSNTSVSALASPVVSIVSMHDGKLIKRVNGTIRIKMVAEKGEVRVWHWHADKGGFKHRCSCTDVVMEGPRTATFVCLLETKLKASRSRNLVIQIGSQVWSQWILFKAKAILPIFSLYSLALGGEWSRTGLSLSTDSYYGNQSNTDSFTCRTNHLTSFAILMQVKRFRISPEHTYALEMITYFGCSLSLLCLLLTIITIPLMRLKETRFKIHFHLCIALAASQAFFLAGMAAIKNKTACTVTAMFLHYFYSAAFMLMLVEGIHLYQKVVIAYKVQKDIEERLYFLFSWGSPLVIVGIAFAVNKEGYTSKKGCWLSLEKGFRWAFIAPVLVILLANVFILVKVLMVMVTLQSDPLKNGKQGKIRLACKGVAILLPLLGLTWFFGVMSVNSDTIVFQYLFTIFNSLQGVFLFAFNYASNKEVRLSFHRTLHRSQMSSL